MDVLNLVIRDEENVDEQQIICTLDICSIEDSYYHCKCSGTRFHTSTLLRYHISCQRGHPIPPMLPNSTPRATCARSTA